MRINTRKGERRALNRARKSLADPIACIAASGAAMLHFDRLGHCYDDWHSWPGMLEDAANAAMMRGDHPNAEALYKEASRWRFGR